MKTRLIICAGITTGVVVTGVFLQGTWLAEPKYQGKPISYWIYQVAMPGKKMELGCKTIKEAGADAIPSLIKALQKKDSVLKRIYISVWWQLPALPQRVLPRPVKAVRIHTSVPVGKRPRPPACIPELRSAE